MNRMIGREGGRAAQYRAKTRSSPANANRRRPRSNGGAGGVVSNLKPIGKAYHLMNSIS